jgi:putative PIN family toxin of toxin-antitoxin system
VLPLASTATVQELVRVLAYPKFGLSQAEQDELLADYLPYAETVRIPQPPPKVPDCRDALDLPFMHLAVTGKAQVFVSGDRDLLAIAAEFERASSCHALGRFLPNLLCSGGAAAMRSHKTTNLRDTHFGH